jgi:hypothetical protein
MRLTVHLGFLFFLLLALVIPAYAGPATLTLINNGTTIAISDGGAGDISSVEGVIVFMGSINGWFVNVTTGITKPAQGSAASPQMDLASLNVSSKAAGSITIKFADDDFGPLAAGTFAAMIGGVTSGSVEYDTYLSGNLLTSQGPFTGGSFSGMALSGSVPIGSTYSLMESVTITHKVAGVSSLGAKLEIVHQVPEPALIILLGIALSSVSLFAWRWKV